jgi:sugar lactone lactonase YvrE
MLVAGAMSQDRLGDLPDEHTGTYKPQPIASFTGPGNFKYTLPQGAEITLDIIAGKADPSQKKPGIEFPVAAVTDSQGRLLVADGAIKVIHIFDFVRHKYYELDVEKRGVKSIGGLAVNDKGEIYLTDPRQGKIFTFTAKGVFVGYLQPAKDKEGYYVSPIGIAIDHAHGYIYVCDSGRDMVIKLNRSGHVLRMFGIRGGGTGPGEFKRPTQVAVLQGEVFVLDSGNRRIQKLNSDGKYLAEIRAPEGVGLAVDRRQRILLSQPTLHRIAVMDQDGHLLSTFQSGDGNAFDPFSLWLKSDQCLYVTDKANKVVDLFRVDGGSEEPCYE